MTARFKKAMILAAGFGTRLLPLTENLPKALVNVNGEPMIKSVIDKLVSAGIKEIIINIHHHAKIMQQYFDSAHFDAEVALVTEENILGTGGGVKNAKKYLEGSGSFVLYNADVSSEIDLAKMAESHFNNDCIATLAVNQRTTARPLLFNKDNTLAGRKVNNENFIFSKQSGELTERAFCGIHIISSKIFETFPAETHFDIIDHYMELVKAGYKISSYDIGNVYWKDLGKLSDLQ